MNRKDNSMLRLEQITHLTNGALKMLICFIVLGVLTSNAIAGHKLIAKSRSFETMPKLKSTYYSIFLETQRIEHYSGAIAGPYSKKDTLFFKIAKSSFANGNLKKALRYINRAIKKKNIWVYRSYKAEILRMLGNNVDAVALYEKEAHRCEQPIGHYQWIIMTQVLAGHLEEAMQRIFILESKYPEQQSLKAQQGWIYAKQGNYDKAIQLYADNDAALGWVYALKDDKKNALKHLENLLSQHKKEWWHKWDIALIYAALPEKDNALRLLEDIVATLEKENPAELVKLGWRMGIESDYDPLRADKKFQELMARTKYPLHVFLKK